MKNRMTSCVPKTAIVIGGLLLAASASAAGLGGVFGKGEVTMPTSVSESAPWRAAERPAVESKSVGSTRSEATGYDRDRSGTSRATAFPSSVDESAPWLTGR